MKLLTFFSKLRQLNELIKAQEIITIVAEFCLDSGVGAGDGAGGGVEEGAEGGGAGGGGQWGANILAGP